MAEQAVVLDAEAIKAAKIAAVKARKESASAPNPFKELKVKISVCVRMDKEVKMTLAHDASASRTHEPLVR